MEPEKNIQQQPVQQPAPQPAPPQQAAPPQQPQPEKFCKYCGGKIHADAVICPLCGRQVEEIRGANAVPQQIVINNSNNNTVEDVPYWIEKNKWVALLLCFFLGFLGAHKFYEGKIGMGILYLFTGGLFLIGVIIDFIALLFKPNPYYV